MVAGIVAGAGLVWAGWNVAGTWLRDARRTPVADRDPLEQGPAPTPAGSEVAAAAPPRPTPPRSTSAPAVPPRVSRPDLPAARVGVRAEASPDPPNRVGLAGIETKPLPAPSDRAERLLGTPVTAAEDALSAVRVRLAAGLAAADDAGDPLDSRRQLTAALDAPSLAPAEAAAIRESATAISARLVLGAEIVAGDPFSFAYTVEPGDQLRGIARRQGLLVDWRFILRINGIGDERHLRAGQRLKLVTGPFHALVSKTDYRMDLYIGDGSQRVYVASYPVGLGRHDSTPTGLFGVRPDSKLIDPHWINPVTRERFEAADPKNPIGEHWIGLQGLEEHNRTLPGYGIHGTIEPETIGTQASMGCIRMLPEDVAIVYEVLTEDYSTVEIR
jgi:hypothetical protein